MPNWCLIDDVNLVSVTFFGKCEKTQSSNPKKRNHGSMQLTTSLTLSLKKYRNMWTKEMEEKNQKIQNPFLDRSIRM